MNKIYLLILTGCLFANVGFAQFTYPKSKIKNPVTTDDKVYNFFMSKRLAVATAQRDSMFRMTDSLMVLHTQMMEDTVARALAYVAMTASRDSVQSEYNRLSNDYTALMQSASDKADQFSQALQQKNAELNKKQNELAQLQKALEQREKRLSYLERKIRQQDSLTRALTDVIRNALLSFKSDDLGVELKNGQVYVSLSDKLLFQSGKAEVQEQGQRVLAKLAEVLGKDVTIDILVEGHTDNVPIKTPKYADNWDLSAARAINIVRFLTANHAIDPKRITAAGKGEYEPRASNTTPEGRAKNRRTEIILSPQLGKLYEMIFHDQNNTGN